MKYLNTYWKGVSEIIDTIPNIEKLYGKTVLITGATGMVCSTVVDVISWLNHNRNTNIHLVLAGRNEINMHNRFSPILSKDEYVFLNYDATKTQSIDLSFDYIIHGASNANPSFYDKEPVETLLGNIIGLNSVLNAAVKNIGSRVLFISSSEVYGNRFDNDYKPFCEDDYGFVDILNPRACYPNGKRSAETLCAAFRQEYCIDFVTVRLGHIYGPSITKSDTRASAMFTRDAALGNNIVMKSPGNQLRSYCLTLDCASAILTVLINGESGNAYNISNKNSIVTIRDIAEALSLESGVKVVFDNPTDAEQRSYNLMNNSVLDSSKIENLGWKAIFDLKQGIQLTLSCFEE